jgi:puromycin-sensitive aminopeptidase
MTTTSYRLPRSVLPQDYDVLLAASPKKKGFTGELVLTAKVVEPTTVVELHALDVKVDKATARVGKKSFKARVKARKDRETVELVFDKPLPKGKLEVELSFKGALNPSMHGLYRAADGADIALVSQCEATDARRIFPCMDEPDLKATLRWQVLTDAGYEVVTNGMPEKTTKKRGQVLHSFKRTRIIPTYLAALTIGKLEATKAKKIAGVPCRILAGPGKLGQTDFAVEITERVLPWFQEYFGQPYNYQKLDQVAVPGFDAGAMENVGAIFYRQNLLLMQPGATSWYAQKRIAEVVSHEIAHQWFGNLVTMKWWDDLWLNEAFATWIAYKAVDLWKPEWRMWDEYLDSKEGALEADSLVSTHPIYSEVKSPAEATELFDVITYEKGCAVLRMCENFLGHEKFRDGIRAYQTAFKNSNARGADLWTKLSEASEVNVTSLMESWIQQPGFPLLTAELVKKDGRTILRLAQRRFFANPSEMKKSHEQTWNVPLVIRYGGPNGSKVHRALLHAREQEINLPDDTTWVYANDEAAGFYRVHHGAAMLERILTDGLSHLSPASRLSLINDEWALVRAGVSDIGSFMSVLEAFRGERDYIVVRTLAGRLAYLDQRLVRDQERPVFADFVRWLLSAQLTELGFDAKGQETPDRSVRRASLVNALGDVGRDAGVLAEAQKKTLAEMNDPMAVEANLAGVVVALAAIGGDSVLLERYIEVFQKRKEERAAPEMVARYLGALGYFEDGPAVERALQACMDGTVPQEQLRTVLMPLIGRRATQRRTWDFLKSNWETLSPRVGLMGISRLVEATGSLPVDLLGDVEKFYAAHPIDEAKRAVQKAIEALRLRQELITRQGGALSAWLEQRRTQLAAKAHS